MKKVFVAFLFVLALAGIIAAQKTKNNVATDASNTTSAQQQGRQIDLQSDTRLAAQLQSALDTRYAKVGDRVILKTTEAIKQNGHVVIAKGTQVLGRVTDLQKETESTGESHITLLFDRLRSGSTEIPITATVLSITQARSSAQANNATIDSDLTNQSSAGTRSTSAPRNNGGLLGGVGNAAGGVLNTTTSTVGNVAGTTTNAVGSTIGATTNPAGNATGSLRGLQITQSSNASAQGGSTLSLTGGNLRLESGATFNLSLSNSAGTGNP